MKHFEALWSTVEHSSIVEHSQTLWSILKRSRALYIPVYWSQIIYLPTLTLGQFFCLRLNSLFKTDILWKDIILFWVTRKSMLTGQYIIGIYQLLDFSEYHKTQIWRFRHVLIYYDAFIVCFAWPPREHFDAVTFDNWVL